MENKREFLERYINDEFNEDNYEEWFSSLAEDDIDMINSINDKDQLVEFLEDWYIDKRRKKKKKYFNYYL